MKSNQSEEEMYKQQENTEGTFPSTQTKMNVWGGKKTFAELAAECAKKAEEEQIFKKHKEVEEQKKVTYRRNVVPLPQFNNIHRYVEQDDVNMKRSRNQQDDEGWIEVNHKKARRQKTFEEVVNRPPTPEEGDTVWNENGPEEHETCWDERP
jgi:hypothetical protein